MSDKWDWVPLACLVLVIVGVVILVLSSLGIKEANQKCVEAGYDGWLKADGADWCYRIVDGTRVLTPYFVVPKRKTVGQ